MNTLTIMSVFSLCIVSSPQNTGESYHGCFEAVWKTVNDKYFDPTFGGLDWNEIYKRYQPLIASVEKDEEFYMLTNKMLFELGVSHLGIVPPYDLNQIDPISSAEGSIGIDIRLIDGEAVITSVKHKSPAAQAGLRAGLVIQSVGEKAIKQIAEKRETDGLLTPPLNDRNKESIITNDILSLIYGPPDADVSITYLDERGESQYKKIVRGIREGKIILSDTLPPLFVDFEAKLLDSSIVYIRFNAFLPPVDEKFSNAIETLGNINGLIIDLRGNPGGAFFIRKALVEKLLTKKTLFWKYKRRDGIEEVYLEPSKKNYEGPVAILVDVRSWSSSEEFAGGMQSIGRAVVIGERTPGRVLVQEEAQMPNGAVLIYPVAQTRTKDDKVLEGNGVIPDIEVKLDRSSLLQGIDNQIEAAIGYIESKK
jgi:carboxyl-terminal processing protease